MSAQQEQQPEFVLADAATYEPPAPVDVAISNALIHWIPDHRSLISRIRGMLKPGGQLAIQFPNNGAHRYQQIAYALQSEAPFNAYPPNPIDANLLSLEEYAQTLHELGFESIDVHMRAGFVALFAFAFAVTAGTAWEIFEFAVDQFFGTQMQKPMLGDPSGLTDTMWDLIVDALGAAVISSFGWWHMKRGRPSFIEAWIDRFVERNPRFFKD